MEMNRRACLLALAFLVLVAAVFVAAAGLLVWRVRFRQPPVVNGELAFETVERDRSPDVLAQFFPRAAPGLVVLTSSQDIRGASDFINKTAVDRLRELDWDENFAIVVFRGYQAENVPSFEILRVVRQDAEVGVYATTGLVGEENIPTSPYHIVAVRKVGQWDGLVTFRLYVDTAGEAAQVSKEVPESSIPLWPR